MDRKIARLKNHFIVCGYGRIGKVICDKLLEENFSVVVIDKNPELSDTLDALGLISICDDATDEGTLLKAGVPESRALIAALGTDTENVFLVLTGRQLAPALKGPNPNWRPPAPTPLKPPTKPVPRPWPIG